MGIDMAYNELFIDGRWVEPESARRIDVVDPTTEQIFATVPDADPVDIDAAVAAARRAFPTWSETAPSLRSKLLRAVADALESRKEEIAELEAHEIGMPKHQAINFQVGMGVRAFTTAAVVLEGFEFEDRTDGLVIREPIGVVGAIAPWNFPLYQIGAKVAYAMAAGCTVVVKPSELAPVSAFALAQIMDEIGVPAGVFNLVSGTGAPAGEALVAHPDVDMVTFTGSTRTGMRVAELAARSVKRVALELGGKSPNVVLDDADFTTTIPAGVTASYTNCGQTCSALTRMLVPRSRLDEVESLAKAAAEAFTVGDPLAESSRLGPLISAEQRTRVQRYIQTGIDEGAMLVTGGLGSPPGLQRGYFVRPTVFSNVRSDMVIAQEEIFGPVLSILPYDTEEEAIGIANDTVYGLCAAVWGSPARAERVARRIRAGQVRVNGVLPPAVAPFGGYKYSGLGREHGPHGLAEFLEIKALSI